jgi:hypothetical protein
MNIFPKSKIAGHGAKFGRKKEEAVAALASSRTVEEAARIVGLSPQTLYRWLKDPEFAAACDEAGQAILGQAPRYRARAAVPQVPRSTPRIAGPCAIGPRFSSHGS